MTNPVASYGNGTYPEGMSGKVFPVEAGEWLCPGENESREPWPAKGGALEGTFRWPGQMMEAEQPHSPPGLGQSGEKGSQGEAELVGKKYPNPEL